MVLETGVTCTGGLSVGPIFKPVICLLEGAVGQDVGTVGNAAILDLQGRQLCVSYCSTTDSTSTTA